MQQETEPVIVSSENATENEEISIEEKEENVRFQELEKALCESKVKLAELKRDKAQTTIEHNTANNIQLLAEGFVNKSKKKKK